MTERVLLTGGVGFIGHHTVEHFLKNTDWELVLLDRLTYSGNQNYLTDLSIWKTESKRVKFIYHDFRAPLSATTLRLIGHVDYIVHMGAETHVDNSILDPMIFAESNVIGTVNILQAARELSPRLMIYVSTDEVYGPVKRIRPGIIDDGKWGFWQSDLHKEGEAHRPSNPYSASKAGAEAFCYAFWNTYDLPVIVTNTMNNFGERQHVEKFIPKTVKAILSGFPVTLHVRRDDYNKIIDVSSRCWLHARNHADALMFLLNTFGNFNSTATKAWQQYNIVGEWATVQTIAQKIGDILGKEYTENFVDFHSFRPGHDMHYGLDGSLLSSLGWTPPLSLDFSLEHTVNWMLKNPQWL